MRRSKRIIGLDLGTYTFKLVQLELRKSGPVVLQWRVKELPSGADSAGRLETLKQLLKGIPLDRSTRVVSILDDPFLLLRQVTVPPMPPGELADAVRWELQPYLAMPAETATVDVQILGEVQESAAKKVRVLAVAAPTSMIKEHLEFLAQAGVRPAQLVPKGVAICAWLRHARPESAEGPIALLDLGGTASDFLVIQKSQPIFVRKIPVAGSDITKGMTGVLMTSQGQVGLSEEEAEALKRQVGIPTAGSTDLGPKGISGTQLLSLIRGSLERLAVEVERSLTFHGESTQGKGVTELILFGGGAQLKGLPEWLGDRLGLKVTVPSMEEAAPELSLVPALGASLTAGTGLNLLPQSVKEAGRLQVRRAALIGIGTAVALGIVLLRVGMGLYERNLVNEAAALGMERSALGAELSLAQAALNASQRQRTEPYWEELFKELSQAVPREIYLTGLSIQEGQIGLRGRIRPGNRAADQILAAFTRTLREGLFTQVTLGSHRQIEGPLRESEFEVTCRIQGS